MIRYIRSVILPSKLAQLLLQTGMKWQQDDCPSMAAALSYYALFSLFPMLLLILSFIGSLLGANTDLLSAVREVAGRYFPADVHALVKETMVALNQSRVGAGMVGFVLLLYSASTVFAVLSHSVQKIWRSSQAESASRPIHRMAITFVLNKLWSFLLPFAAALLLLISLVSGLAIKIIVNIVDTFQETFAQERFAWMQIDEFLLGKGLQVVSSLFILTLVICLLFKLLPSVTVRWGDVWLGGLLTSFSLVGLQQLVSNSVISIGQHYLSYGVVGSVMILLLWIYLTCMLFFIGCEFSYVYAHLFGSRSHKAINTIHSRLNQK